MGLVSWLKASRTYASQNFLLILVVVDFKLVVVEVVQSDHKQEGVRNVPLVRDGQPQFQIFQLVGMALVDVDAAGKTYFSQLLLRVIVQVFHVQHQVLLPQLTEEHV